MRYGSKVVRGGGRWAGFVIGHSQGVLGFYGQDDLVDGFSDGDIGDSLRGGGFLFRNADAVAGRIMPKTHSI